MQQGGAVTTRKTFTQQSLYFFALLARHVSSLFLRVSLRAILLMAIREIIEDCPFLINFLNVTNHKLTNTDLAFDINFDCTCKSINKKH